MPKINVAVIKKIIKEKYGTRQKFTEAFGITRQTLDRWFKHEEINQRKLETLAKFLSVEHFELQVPENINQVLMAAISQEILKVEQEEGIKLTAEQHLNWCVLLYNRHKNVDMNEQDYDLIRYSFNQLKKA